MTAKFSLVTLGCPKNEADSDRLRRRLLTAGHTESSADAADIVIVNTCGFIDAAKEESLAAIFDAADEAHGRGAKIAAVGCLVERYREELGRELPEADILCGLDTSQLLDELAELGTAAHKPTIAAAGRQRPRATAALHAYVKISDGCDRRCAFCAIPLIKGTYEAQPPDAIVADARAALAEGARELVLVGQDTSRWEYPGYGRLERLLAAMRELEPTWVRMLYLQPDGVDAALLQALAASTVPYVDIPLQHASARLLRRMGRQGSGDEYLSLLESVRDAVPAVAARSTFIVGFPGETDEDFEELLDFVAAANLAVAGVFVFDAQEGTPATAMPNQVPSELAEERAAALADAIETAAHTFWSAFEGQSVEVLVERGCRGADGEAVGRIAVQAPDVDGVTYLRGAAVRRGDLVRAVVDLATGYDLHAHVVR